MLEEKHSFLSNYGDIDSEGLGKITQKAIEENLKYSKTDAELIGSVFYAIGEDRGLLEIIHKRLGYDHFIVNKPSWGDQKLYVIFSNSAVRVVEVDKIK